MKEQRNSKSRVFLPGGGGGSGTASRDWKRVLSLIVFLRAACLTRALGNPRLPFSEVRAAGGAPETPVLGGPCGRSGRRRCGGGSPPKTGLLGRRRMAPISAPSPCAHCSTHCPSAGKARGNHRERGQKDHGGAKGGEQGKQDDRTLAPQPSAKLQTGLLRWKAAVS